MPFEAYVIHDALTISQTEYMKDLVESSGQVSSSQSTLCVKGPVEMTCTL